MYVYAYTQASGSLPSRAQLRILHAFKTKQSTKITQVRSGLGVGAENEPNRDPNADPIHCVGDL